MTAAPFSPGSARLRIHQQLIDMRKTQRVTQAAVAERLGVCCRTFQRWENSEVELSAIDLIRWAAALGLATCFVPIGQDDTSVVSAPSRSAFALRAHQPAAASVHEGEDASGRRTFPGNSASCDFPSLVGAPS